LYDQIVEVRERGTWIVTTCLGEAIVDGKGDNDGSLEGGDG